MEFVLELRKVMASHNYMMAIRDDFQSLLVKPVIILTEKRIIQEPIETFVRKRAFGAIVECVQNICRPGQSKFKKKAILLVSKTDKYFVINAGNIVTLSEKEKWSGWLMAWENSDINQLKLELLSLKRSKTGFNRTEMEKMAVLNILIKAEKNFSFTFHPMIGNEFLFEIEIKISYK